MTTSEHELLLDISKTLDGLGRALEHAALALRDLEKESREPRAQLVLLDGGGAKGA